MPRRRNGFTLIEVMITVAIVAILGSIAVPSYQSYVRRSQLSEAMTQLSDLRVKLEQYYQDNHRYGSAACVDGYAAATQPKWAVLPRYSKYFYLTCTLTNSGQGYLLGAQGSAGKLTAGYTYTVNDAGDRRTLKFASKAVSLDCWATRSAGGCDN